MVTTFTYVISQNIYEMYFINKITFNILCSNYLNIIISSRNGDCFIYFFLILFCHRCIISVYGIIATSEMIYIRYYETYKIVCNTNKDIYKLLLFLKYENIIICFKYILATVVRGVFFVVFLRPLPVTLWFPD